MENTLLFILIILFLILFLIIYQNIQDQKLIKTVTKPNRGTRTERIMVLKLLKAGIPKETIFHDLYLKKMVITIVKLI